MTSPSIQIAGQTFTKRVSKLRLPYIDQAVGFYLFGTNAASSLRNLASGASQNLTEIGAPTYGTGYATIGQNNGFDTHLLLDTPYTQIVVSKFAGLAGSRMAVIGRGNGADGFVDMLRHGDVASFTIDAWPNGAQAGGFDNLQATDFRFFGVTWGGTGTACNGFAADTSGMLRFLGSTPVTKTVTPTTNLRFGNSYVGSVSSGEQIAAIVLVPFVMNMPQVKEIYAYLKPFLAARGVTVI